MRNHLLLAALLACSSCNVIEQPSGLIPRWTAAWKEVATQKDRDRLRLWRTSFVNAIDAARKAGHSADIAREGALLEPDSGLPSPVMANGSYRCRVFKLGPKATENLAFAVSPWFTCRVRADRGLQRLGEFGGPQRFVGLIFPDDAMREVFLGTLVLADERRALQYSQDEMRDVAGYLERVGPSRWRVIMPEPHFESQLDVMELVPLAP